MTKGTNWDISVGGKIYVLDGKDDGDMVGESEEPSG